MESISYVKDVNNLSNCQTRFSGRIYSVLLEHDVSMKWFDNKMKRDQVKMQMQWKNAMTNQWQWLWFCNATKYECEWLVIIPLFASIVNSEYGDVGRRKTHQGWVFIDVLFSMDEHTLAELSLPISPAQNIDVESQVRNIILWQQWQGQILLLLMAPTLGYHVMSSQGK